VSTPETPVLPGRTPTFDTLIDVREPSTAQELADALREAVDESLAVVPIGGGGALPVGNQTSDAAIAVSTRALSQVIDYQPTDMTLSVQAGTTLAEVRSVLGKHGQMLPIEAPLPLSATIGGLLATALTGPRRYGGGSLRDVIIGISVAYPDGTVGKAGGLVVKNVSGFDMMRIHYGALGTLGVITSANFKVLPIPRAEFTVVHPFSDLAELADPLPRLRRPSVRPVSLIVRKDADQWLLAARFEGRPSGLAAVESAIAGSLDVTGKLSDATSSDYWQSLMDARAFSDRGEVRLQIRTLPTESISAARHAIEIVERAGLIPSRIEIEPGTGLATMSWSHRDGVSAATIASIRESLPRADVAILTAPDDVKRSIDVWGGEPDAIDLMRRLKQEFDPNRILNPGRFAGRM
jgi:glycolate dehydrogenase FAD-binding subunit